MSLKSCPFCDAVPIDIACGDYEILHKENCYLSPKGEPQYITSEDEANLWNQRANGKALKPSHNKQSTPSVPVSGRMSENSDGYDTEGYSCF